MIFRHDGNELLCGGVPPTAARTDSGEPMRINELAVLKRTLLRAVRSVACGFVDIETAFDVGLAVARHRRALPPPGLDRMATTTAILSFITRTPVLSGVRRTLKILFGVQSGHTRRT